MEVIITNIDFEYVEFMSMRENYIEYSTAFVSFDIFKNGNKLSGKTEVPFEQYKKMNHDELTSHIKELFTVA
ncbi:hypothetical protein COE40_19020 [Bacillus cereus]|nr:hypothetical protein COE40_19020 [Bacillus cereus]